MNVVIRDVEGLCVGHERQEVARQPECVREPCLDFAAHVHDGCAASSESNGCGRNSLDGRVEVVPIGPRTASGNPDHVTAE